MDARQIEQAAGKFEQIHLHLDRSEGILWLYTDPVGRPCFSMELGEEIIASHRVLLRNRGYLRTKNGLERVHYQVITSMPGKPYCLGGDLELFLHCVRKRDQRTLSSYAKLCIDVLYPTISNFGDTVTTIAVVHGQALGGGFESALSSSVLIAERGAKMGLPEVLFNLFPGMGAYQLLCRRLSPAQAERMILSGRLYDADELHDMGVVDIVADPGEGGKAVYDYVRRHRNHRNSQLAVQKVRQMCQPISYKDLMRVCHLWVDAAMQLSERDLRTMERLARAQYKLADEPVRGRAGLRAIA